MRIDEAEARMEKSANQFLKKLKSQTLDELFLPNKNFQELLEVNAQDIDELKREIDHYIKHSDYENASKGLFYLIFFEPEVARNYIRLGGILMHLKHPDQAVGIFALGANVDPANPAPFLYMGESYLQLNEMENAKTAFEKCHEIAKASSNPNHKRLEELSRKMLTTFI
jgi:tetratricopeptide (TPR) repeat protein